MAARARPQPEARVRRVRWRPKAARRSSLHGGRVPCWIGRNSSLESRGPASTEACDASAKVLRLEERLRPAGLVEPLFHREARALRDGADGIPSHREPRLRRLARGHVAAPGAPLPAVGWRAGGDRALLLRHVAAGLLARRGDRGAALLLQRRLSRRAGRAIRELQGP